MLHRRDCLRIGTASVLGLSLAGVLRQEAKAARRDRPRARSVILLWLGGGPSTIDLWDLKPDAPAQIRGEFQPIATAAKGVSICEHLPRTAQVMDRCVLVRSLHHGITAHGPATVTLQTGNPPAAGLVYPSLGSLAAKVLEAEPGVPVYAKMPGATNEGATAGYLGTAYNPFDVEGDPVSGRLRASFVSLPDGFSLTDLAERDRLRNRFDARFKAVDEADLPASLDRFHQQALDILRSGKTRKALDLTLEPPPVRQRYGLTPFGQGVLAARRLIEAGTRFVTVALNGWDTHAANFVQLRTRLLPQLDGPLATLLADLDQRGLLAETIVYCAGEFNRTPVVNSSAGRDHWARSMAVLLAGGGLARGAVYGKTDARGEQPSRDDCSPADVAATMFHGLGLEPGHEVRTTTGRPMALFREGKVLPGLLA